mgnify:CR=1 FL=1
MATAHIEANKEDIAKINTNIEAILELLQPKETL